MKTAFKVLFFMFVTVMAMYGFAKFTGANIVNSTINSTAIGGTTPSTGAFTTLTSSTSAQFNGSVLNNGTGFKHVRQASTTTGSGVNGTSSTTVTWPTPAFPDGNYTTVCVSENSAAFVAGVGSHTATNFNVNIENSPGATAAVSVILDCIGVHD